MKYLPSYRCSLLSPLDSEEVLRRLKEQVEPKKIVRFDISLTKEPKPFEGSIYSTSFFINKIHHTSHQLRPEIQGKLKSREDGTQIDLKFTPDISIWMYLVIVPIILILFFVQLATGNLGEGVSTSFVIFFPVFIMLLFPSLIFFSYIPKVDSGIAFLRNLFEAKEIHPQAKV